MRRPLRLSRRAVSKLALTHIDPETAAMREAWRENRRTLRAQRRASLRARAIAPGEDLVFEVAGIPQPQGSLDLIPSASTGRLIAVHPKALVHWRALVVRAARTAMRGRPLLAGPLALEVVFYLPRPPSLPRRIEKPERKPDLDKLLRAIGDALTESVCLDDAQITAGRQRKRFSASPHARIRIGPDLED